MLQNLSAETSNSLEHVRWARWSLSCILLERIDAALGNLGHVPPTARSG